MRPIDLVGMATLAALAITPPLHAQAKARPVAGNVTRAQVQAQVKQVFDLADTNKDNFMSRAEFGKRMGAVLNRTPPGTPGAPSKEEAQKLLTAAVAAFNAVDVNHDGKLSRTEAGARALAAFDSMDSNHDGVVTPAEKRAASNAATPIGPVGPTGPADSGRKPASR
ncbi:MAG: EF-hand domain-containing protein [Sphingomonas sp.]|jgi:hypothetical protein|uniref:EF-hand domain-containing protein n=1 Tax=Sphingomonas sp. TaxID=28214 RepID=UPI003565B56E